MNGMASLNEKVDCPEEIIEKFVMRHAEKMGFLVLAVGGRLMEQKNQHCFRPKEW